jgi:GAF domain-containing protein
MSAPDSPSQAGRPCDTGGPLGASRLIDTFLALGEEITARSRAEGVLPAIVAVAAFAVPGAQCASISQRDARERWSTLAASEEAAAAADAMQYELGSGPTLDAVRTQGVMVSGGLGTDRRWGGFGQRAARSAELRSVLAIRIQPDRDDAALALTIYSRAPGAFGDASVAAAMLLAAQAASALSRADAVQQAEQLQQALDSGRDIGVAIGILMSSRTLSRQAAFDLLRDVSQVTHRKLRDIASDVVETGQLELPPGPRPR